MGVYWIIFYAGTAVLPPAGWAADVGGGAAAALLVAAAFYAIAVAALTAYGALLARRSPGAGSALGGARIGFVRARASCLVVGRGTVPLGVIALVVLWRLRYRLILQDLAEMFLVHGTVFSHSDGAGRPP
jgi:hypothetical protein